MPYSSLRQRDIAIRLIVLYASDIRGKHVKQHDFSKNSLNLSLLAAHGPVTAPPAAPPAASAAEGAAEGRAAEGTAAAATTAALGGGGGHKEESCREELHPGFSNFGCWCVQTDSDALRRRGLPYL